MMFQLVNKIVLKGRRCRYGSPRIGAGLQSALLGSAVFLPVLVLSALLLPAGIAAAADIPSPCPAGDALAKRARKLYGEADLFWQRAAEVAKPLGDAAVDRRFDRSRAALASLQLDLSSYEKLGARVGHVDPSVVTASASGAAQKRDLSRLRRAFSAVIKKQRSAAIRDRLLFHEMHALIQQSLGDIEQAAADAEYLRALKTVEARNDNDPARLARSIYLRYRLRDFQGALLLSKRGADFASLDSFYCAHQFRVHDAAVFAGDDATASAVQARISKTCPKRVQIARNLSGLGSSRFGSRAELLLIVNGLVDWIREFDLPKRAETLAAYFAATSAIDLGEYALAAELLRVRSSWVPDDSWLSAHVFGRLSWALDYVGEWERALEAVRSAQQHARRLGDAGEELVARLSHDEARTLLAMGKVEDARAIAGRLLKMANLPRELHIQSRLLLAGCFFELSREDPRWIRSARGTVQAAQREIESAVDGELEARSELELIVSVHLGNLARQESLLQTGAKSESLRDEAMKLQDSAMRKAYDLQNFQLAAVCSANLGELYLEAGDLGKARQFVTWSLEQARDKSQFATLWRAHWYLARIADASGEIRAAERELAEAVRLVESYRDRILEAGAKAGFLTDKLDLYRYMVARELKRDQPAAAFTAAERSRAQALVESLGWRYLSLESGEETELYRQYISLVGREANRRHGGERTFFGVREARAESHEDLSRKLLDLRAGLIARQDVSPKLKALLHGAPISAGKALALLPEDTTLVEYFDIGSELIAFVLQDARIQTVRLGVEHRALDRSVRSFMSSGGADEEAARLLHAKLIAPLESRVKHSRVVIVPYGVLHGLPFESFRSTSGYQIQRWEISYLPSASMLQFLEWNRKKTPTSGDLRLLALADPSTDYDGDGQSDKVELSGARQEVSGFALRFDHPSVFYGEEARESLLRELSSDLDVLHIASHGEFYPNRPWDSTLFLASDGDRSDRDGRLRAHEVYGLDLRGLSLVALSGCETGVTDISAGDDPAGLATAFLHSGASSLLVSLWKVEDRATSQLMKSFYRGWIKERKSRGAALREAKLEMLRGDLRHPRQWASFVLVADG